METHVIIASNGAEIIDCTPEAKNRIAAMEYMERKHMRNYHKKANVRKRLLKNPLWKLAAFCGIV